MTGGGLHTPRLFGHPALGRAHARQLPRRDEAIRRDAGRGHRDDLLHGRPARHHRLAGPREAAPRHARTLRRVHRRRARPGDLHPLQPVPGRRAHAAGLDLQLRRADGLDEADDAVQGQGRQERREGQPRALRLPRADGRRHPRLPRHACAGGRGPEAAPRADAQYRREVQPRLRGRVLPRHRTGDRGGRDPGHEPARRHEENVEIRPFGHEPHQPHRRCRHHRPKIRKARPIPSRCQPRPPVSRAAPRRATSSTSTPRWPTGASIR